MKTKSTPMIGRYWRTCFSPMASPTRSRRNETSISRKFWTPPGRLRSKRLAARGKRTAIRTISSRAMMAASGIQASRPSGKKNSAMAGESFSTGG